MYENWDNLSQAGQAKHHSLLQEAEAYRQAQQSQVTRLARWQPLLRCLQATFRRRDTMQQLKTQRNLQAT